MTTPIRRQYLDIKRRYPQAIVFFRLGDFYETFDEDAETVAHELEITLTSRPVGKDQRVPLAGIPYHALDSYLGKLIAKGYKVAICEQTEEPAKGKKLVDRQVVRVVTPGTLVEDSMLSRDANNYLAALIPGDGRCGLAYVDISTGEFACAQSETGAVTAEIERLRPSELLLDQRLPPPPVPFGTLTSLPEGAASTDAAVQRLLKHFDAPSLEALGLAVSALAAKAAGAVLMYLEQSQPQAISHISSIKSYEPGGFMALDMNTRRNLELVESLRPEGSAVTLFSVLNFTRTPMGARLLRKWLGQPLLDIAGIAERQDCVQFFVGSSILRSRMSDFLAKIPDLERLVARLSAAAGSTLAPSVPRDLIALRRGLELVPAIRDLLQSVGVEGMVVERLLRGLRPCEEVAGPISQALVDEVSGDEVIRPGFSEELDELRSMARDARKYLAEMELRERERTGIRSLKVGYNRVFGYYIEVSKANLSNVPGNYQRRQTLVGGERYTTPELQEYEFRVLHAQERREELEQVLLRQVCAQAAAYGSKILETAAAIAAIDVYNGMGEAASRYGYVRPVVDESDVIVVRDGRHPVVERMLPEGIFVPNDTEMSSSGSQVMLLTGPNMAGKSTYLRQVALLVVMAHIGSFVPAREARIGLVDRVFSRVGALDDIAAGQSTFMVEMLETAAILHNATGRSLLVFDEIGRGTSTYDGMAIARAVVEFIHNRPDAASKSLFATHYHELTELASFLPRVRNHNVAVAEENGSVIFLHRILPGGADRSYGVHVARLAGLPRAVVLRAEELLAELETSSKRGLESSGQQGRASTAQPGGQLSLFASDGALIGEIARLEVDSVTPLQALTKLYELVEKARELRPG